MNTTLTPPICERRMTGQMITEAELVAAMQRSGRQVSARTIRNWWSRHILPPPSRTWLGKAGSASYWPDDRVLLQASIAHELVTHKATFARTATCLWILGFDIPLETARGSIEELVAGLHDRLAKRAPGKSLEDAVWAIADRLARQDARIRGGSQTDLEGQALYDFTGESLELLAGAGDGNPDPNNDLWAEDTAQGLLEHIEYLRLRRQRQEGWPQNWPTTLTLETAEEVVKLVASILALPRQQEALRRATPADLKKARRITLFAASRLDEAIEMVTPAYAEKRPFFARIVGGYMWLLFPALLAAMKDRHYRAEIVRWLFSFSMKIRERRPARASFCHNDDPGFGPRHVPPER
jgi:hypothetical protein